jgi:hypothetical protein
MVLRLRRPRWTFSGRAEGDPVTVMIDGLPRPGHIEAVWSKCIDVIVDHHDWAGAGRFFLVDEGVTWCRGRTPSSVATLHAASQLVDSA